MKHNCEVITKVFNGITCTFRHHLDNNLIEIKADDNFAKCNGYDSVNKWVNSIPSLKKSINQHFNGKVPEWLIVTEKGEFVAVDKSKMN